jgi:hypothetical protein
MVLSTSRMLFGVVLVLALLAGGCGNDEDGSPAAGTGTATTAGLSDEYREQIVAIVQRTDELRRDFHDAPPGQETVKSARQIALASRAAARDIDKLRTPASLADLGGQMAENYRQWAAKIDPELGRKPVSMVRLSDVVREYGKLVDDVYEDILIAA